MVRRGNLSRTLSMMMRRGFDLPKGLSLALFLLFSYVVYLQMLGPRKAGRPVRAYNQDGDMSIVVTTMNTEEAPFNYVALSNKLVYAQKHRYEFMFDAEGNGFWHKLDMLERGMKAGTFDWIWWIDFDTLITNTTVRLEDIISDALANHTDPDGVDMILTPDCWPLNAGSMLFRGHERVLPFLQRVWKCGQRPESPSEQDCMLEVIQANRYGEKDKVVFVKQWVMNAFPDEVPCYDDDKRKWEPGMFVLHVAGAWAYNPDHKEEAKNILMKKYAAMIDKES